MSEEVESKARLSSVHLLPCTVHYNGTAPIAQYFLPTVTKERNGVDSEHIAAFRGRELKGVRVPIPEGGVGAVVAESQDNLVQVGGTFNSMIMWEHDVTPNVNAVTKPLSWFKIAKQVHHI